MLYDKVHAEVRIFRIPTIILMISPVCDVFLGVRLLPANLHPIYHAGSWVHPVGQLTPIIHLVGFGFIAGRSFFFVLRCLFCVYFCRLYGWVVVSSYLRRFVHPACSFCVYWWAVFACIGLFLRLVSHCPSSLPCHFQPSRCSSLGCGWYWYWRWDWT